MKILLKVLYTVLPKKAINALGKSSVLKEVRNKLLRPGNKEIIISEIVKWGNGKFVFFAPLKIAIKAKNNGIENKLLRNALKLLNDRRIKNPVILDIGANFGFVSLALQANLDSNTKIYSFEPHPEICSVFEKSIKHNRIHNIEVENAAIGSEDCFVEINLFGQSSNILENQGVTIGKVKVKQIKLDNFLNEKMIKPDFIKIDVDGYELNVLKGLKETILNHKPIMVIETNDDHQILEFLKECNYNLFDLDLNEFEGIPNNIFCISKS